MLNKNQFQVKITLTVRTISTGHLSYQTYDKETAIRVAAWYRRYKENGVNKYAVTTTN